MNIYILCFDCTSLFQYSSSPRLTFLLRLYENRETLYTSHRSFVDWAVILLPDMKVGAGVRDVVQIW